MTRVGYVSAYMAELNSPEIQKIPREEITNFSAYVWGVRISSFPRCATLCIRIANFTLDTIYRMLLPMCDLDVKVATNLFEGIF